MERDSLKSEDVRGQMPKQMYPEAVREHGFSKAKACDDKRYTTDLEHNY